MPNVQEFEVSTGEAMGNLATMTQTIRQVTLKVSGIKLLCLAEECKMMHTEWCAHLAHACATGQDQHVFWGAEPGVSPLPAKQFLFHIPIFPTVGVWTPLVFTGGDVPIGKRYAVEWTHFPERDEPQFICFISPGEGRQAIRTTLLEIMQAYLRPDAQCLAGHHGVVAQQEWGSKKLRGDAALAPDRWSIWTSNWCLYCTTHNPANDPNLVPLPTGGGGFPS